jgi:hypothetical protein
MAQWDVESPIAAQNAVAGETDGSWYASFELQLHRSFGSSSYTTLGVYYNSEGILKYRKAKHQVPAMVRYIHKSSEPAQC